MEIKREYYENGQIKEEGTYENGKPEGLFKRYYQNGQLEVEWFVKNEKTEGLFKVYHENGQLQSEAIYKEGMPDGPFKEYYSNGQLKDEGVYRNGKLEGLRKTYSDSGQLSWEGVFRNGEIEVRVPGVKSNICTSCGEQNNPTFEKCYQCGNKINRQVQRAENGIPLFSLKEFMSATLGGRPCQRSMSSCEGLPFQCICGKPHNFSQNKIQILRELPKSQLVLSCPEGHGMVCVHLKGIFKITGFESLFGTLEDSKDKDPMEVIAQAYKSRLGVDVLGNDEIAKANIEAADEIINKIDFGKHYYQMKYREHYKPILNDIADGRKAICELYLFRVWTTQFGFRLCCADKGKIAERLVFNTVNLCVSSLAVGLFNLYNQVDVCRDIGGDLKEILVKRFEEYDQVFFKYRAENNLLPVQVCSLVMDNLKISSDANKVNFLCADFQAHMGKIAEEANDLGIIKRSLD